jgi:hypothetical protein
LQADALLVYSLNKRLMRLLNATGTAPSVVEPDMALLPPGAKRPDRCEHLYATYDPAALNPRVRACVGVRGAPLSACERAPSFSSSRLCVPVSLLA